MTRTKTTANFLPGFTIIAPSIYEHTPSPSQQDLYLSRKDTDVPSLILLCTWTGAQQRYIAKYTEEYQTLFPSARIMVVATTAKDLCLRNSKRKQDRLQPAVERISSLEYLNASGNTEGILLHVFSEGGSNKACELAEAYFNITGQRLPVSALCFDSTPGHPRYLRLCNALNKSLPQIPVLRHTGLLFGSAVLGAIWITYRIVKGAENNVITRTRRRLLDPEHFDLSVPRCYLYSKNDALIAWQDVNEHAEESVLKGIPVTEVLFEGSGHVEHAKCEPDLYWNAVVATWRSAHSIEEKPQCVTTWRRAHSIEEKPRCVKTWRRAHSIEEKKQCYVIVEEVDADTTDSIDTTRWSDADSQRTLLPHPDRKILEFDV